MRGRYGTAALALVIGGGLFAGAVAVGGPPTPATASAPAQLEFGRIRLADGPALHYAVQGDPNGRVVILLHGLSDSWYSFAPLLPYLPASWRVYALTQRGHGDSEKPEGDYSPAALARDVAGFMDAMGIERASVVGHSMGGIVAQHVAALVPDRVERLAILASLPTAQTMPGLDEFGAAIHALPDPVPLAFVRDFQLSTIHVMPRQAFVDSVIAESVKLPAHVWRGVIDGMLETGPAPGLDTTGIPTLALWGERDSFMPVVDQLALVATLDARLVVYPDIGHGLHWESPAPVARDLIAFIED